MICDRMIDAEQEKSDEDLESKFLNALMKCIEEAIEEVNLCEDDEDDTFKDVEPLDLDEDDDDESPVVCPFVVTTCA